MDEELHLQPVQTPDILRAAVVIGFATLIGHMIPLLPFLVLPRTDAAGSGDRVQRRRAVRSRRIPAFSLVGDWRTSGLKMVAIGLGAAAIGFLVGRLFHTA